MYEPYGEEKKRLNLKEKFAQLKEKIQEKFRNVNLKDVDTSNLKFNKVTAVIVGLSLLVMVGSISGFVSYTGKLSVLQDENTILQDQNEGLQSQLNDANSQLSQCSSDLESAKASLNSANSQITKLTFDYQSTSTDLQVCNDEKITLATDLDSINDELMKKETDYDTLKDNYDKVRKNLDEVACNYAKNTCGSAGMEYYYLDSDEKVVCCLNEDTCVRDPGSEEVMEIDC